MLIHKNYVYLLFYVFSILTVDLQHLLTVLHRHSASLDSTVSFYSCSDLVYLFIHHDLLGCIFSETLDGARNGLRVKQIQLILAPRLVLVDDLGIVKTPPFSTTHDGTRLQNPSTPIARITADRGS